MPEASPNVLSHANIPVQCLVAIKAASKPQYVYALPKLSLGFYCPIDLDPTHSRNIGKTLYEEFHVTFAYAIIAAYAAIEEMELEVRANNKTPSTMDGNWNPPVLADLEKRLRKAGVDLGEDFHWSVRGGKTRLEKARPPKIIRKSPWSGWQVRDGRVKVVDAIAHVSWLRSRVSAHRLKPELVRVLSVYDAINAQHLARRLLLERLNFWRIWDEYYP